MPGGGAKKLKRSEKTIRRVLANGLCREAIAKRSAPSKMDSIPRAAQTILRSSARRAFRRLLHHLWKTQYLQIE